LTSQLFANIYLNEFDQFVKHKLKIKNYVRYTDDFIIVAESWDYLNRLLPPIQLFLRRKLKLELHPHKVTIRKLKWGIDFLGYVILPCYKLVRKRTLKRILRNWRRKLNTHKNGSITDEKLESTLRSYLGVLGHANTHELQQMMRNSYWRRA